MTIIPILAEPSIRVLLWFGILNEQVTSKLLYGKAFRAPNFAEQYTQNNPVVLGNRNLNPETIHTFEWALDYRPISSLRTAVNLYYYEIKNLIAGTVTYQNSGQSRRIWQRAGMELASR
jgi:outer membrane cobalamin receptor